MTDKLREGLIETLGESNIVLNSRQIGELTKYGTVIVPADKRTELNLKSDPFMHTKTDITSFDKNMARITFKGVELDFKAKAREYQESHDEDVIDDVKQQLTLRATRWEEMA